MKKLKAGNAATKPHKDQRPSTSEKHPRKKGYQPSMRKVIRGRLRATPRIAMPPHRRILQAAAPFEKVNGTGAWDYCLKCFTQDTHSAFAAWYMKMPDQCGRLLSSSSMPSAHSPFFIVQRPVTETSDVWWWLLGRVVSSLHVGRCIGSYANAMMIGRHEILIKK